jgi:hypothetical protein
MRAATYAGALPIDHQPTKMPRISAVSATSGALPLCNSGVIAPRILPRFDRGEFRAGGGAPPPMRVHCQSITNLPKCPGFLPFPLRPAPCLCVILV